jgi:tellurite methyltransferase
MCADKLLQSSFGDHCAPILDVRTHADYCQGHLSDSCNIPLSQLADRLHELPTRRHSLRIVGQGDEVRLAQQLLTRKDYQIVATLDWSLLINPDIAFDHKIELGADSKRLWQPAAIVAEFIQQYGQHRAPGNALDLACGVGRDAVFLAMHGWRVSAVDYLPQTLEKLQTFASNQQVTISRYLLDLEQDLFALDRIEDTFDLIVVVRYLHRPLLQKIKHKINPGGYIVYQTFMQGCESFGKPKNPRYLLQAGELSRVFDPFRILMDKVEYLEDGRPTNVFIAQRPIEP